MRQLKAKHPSKFTIQFHPVLFAGLLEKWETKGPAEVVPKRNFMWVDILRRGNLTNVPIKVPKQHPFRPLLPLRVSLSTPESVREEVIYRIFDDCWGKGIDITAESTLAKILKDFQLNPEEIMASAHSQTIKDTLIKKTKEATLEGVFGVPTMIIDDQLYWGSDQFPLIERYITGEDPVDKTKKDDWLEQAKQAFEGGVKRKIKN
eukprot:TRINITY_DN16949_c0_g1_i1.p1 TRINITY_DN16949_c0_g1~~TRINITY_DN16949_c0_g1_i1.p1  ORF type:complete len:216 (+),score=42.96 TRINITY_DN16949_c0_g1_i1:36-650(+)